MHGAAFTIEDLDIELLVCGCESCPSPLGHGPGPVRSVDIGVVINSSTSGIGAVRGKEPDLEAFDRSDRLFDLPNRRHEIRYRLRSSGAK